MATDRDPSCTLLGASAAGSCPVRTQWDVLRPVTPEPSPAFVAHLAQAADRFRGRMYDRLVELLPATVRIDAGLPRQQRTSTTLEAMRAGAPLIIGGRLPNDVHGGRNAEPRLLVRVGEQPVEGRWRYRPADVHRHGMLVDPPQASRWSRRTSRR